MATVPISVVAFYGDQIDYLAENGFDVTIITSPDREAEKRISGKARVLLIPMSRKFFSLRDVVAFFRILVVFFRNKFDIVQYSSPKAALIGSLSAWLCAVPVRLYLMWGIYYVGQKGLIRFAMKLVERVICFCSNHVAPDSEGNRLFAIEENICNISKISVVGKGSANGVDLERFDPLRLKPVRPLIRERLKIGEKDFVFGFVGRLRSDKGLNELLEAFKILSCEYPDMYLLLVGPEEAGGLSPSSRDFLLHHERVIRTGYQERPEEFMAAMDVLVLPSYREGFAVVNIEAAAMGIPVISTDIEGPKDSVLNNKTGLLVAVKSVNDLVAAMRKMMASEAMRARMSAEGRIWAENFEQKDQWRKIVMHRRALLEKFGNI